MTARRARALSGTSWPSTGPSGRAFITCVGPGARSAGTTRTNCDGSRCRDDRARRLSARYFGLPVCLVGSAVYRPDPLDLDVVIAVPNELFVSMYGDLGDDLDARPSL